MKRFVFNTFAVLSLLLCVATAGLWLRSYWVVESWVGHLGLGHYEVISMKGLAGFHWEPDNYYGNYYGYHAAPLPASRLPRLGDDEPDYGTLDDNAVWAVCGFSFSRHTSGNPAVCWRISAPYWAFVMAFLIGPLLWTVRLARRVWRRASPRMGLCLKCGYDLRAHKPGEKCPECGTPKPTTVLKG